MAQTRGPESIAVTDTTNIQTPAVSAGYDRTKSQELQKQRLEEGKSGMTEQSLQKILIQKVVICIQPLSCMLYSYNIQTFC